MNQVSPKKLLNSKWTVQAENVDVMQLRKKEKHFVIVSVEYDEQNNVSACEIEAVMTKRRFDIDWRSLKDPRYWKMSWN